MRKLTLLSIAVMIAASLWAQSPERMSYQAILRGGNNLLITNQTVSMRISILQGSVVGTAVYVETHISATNESGVVTVEIGVGTVQQGSFAGINWGSGSYFLKTETSPNADTNYTIVGTSQMLSVAYALHAKTASTLSGSITELDPVFGGSVAKTITGADTAEWNSKLSSYTETDPAFSASAASGITAPDTTRYGSDTDPANELQSMSVSATGDTLRLTSGNYVIIPGISAANPSNVQSRLNSGSTPKQLFQSGYPLDSLYGKTYQGGLIFYLDTITGTGLVAAPSDQSTGAEWGCFGTTISGADGTAIGTGAQNTIDIEAGCTTAGTAADICANLVLNSYSDWFLPSKDELSAMYNNLYNNGLGGFTIFYGWSSSENSNYDAWLHNFNYGIQSYHDKNNAYCVRAVRAF